MPAGPPSTLSCVIWGAQPFNAGRGAGSKPAAGGVGLSDSAEEEALPEGMDVGDTKADAKLGGVASTDVHSRRNGSGFIKLTFENIMLYP